MYTYAEDPKAYKEAINALVQPESALPASAFYLETDPTSGGDPPDGSSGPAVHGTYVAPQGADIFSPYTESSIKPREFYKKRLYVDSAGLLIYAVLPLKKIYLKRRDGKEVKFILKEPPTPTPPNP